jgi:hypothetical protein
MRNCFTVATTGTRRPPARLTGPAAPAMMRRPPAQWAAKECGHERLEHHVGFAAGRAGRAHAAGAGRPADLRRWLVRGRAGQGGRAQGPGACWGSTSGSRPPPASGSIIEGVVGLALFWLVLLLTLAAMFNALDLSHGVGVVRGAHHPVVRIRAARAGGGAAGAAGLAGGHAGAGAGAQAAGPHHAGRKAVRARQHLAHQRQPGQRAVLAGDPAVRAGHPGRAADGRPAVAAARDDDARRWTSCPTSWRRW